MIERGCLVTRGKFMSLSIVGCVEVHRTYHRLKLRRNVRTFLLKKK